jgi:hypothetical protein
MFSFTKRRKFEVNAHELIDFLRILGRIGIQFKISGEYVVEDVDGKSERYRRVTVFGTRKQIADILEAQEIIYDYCSK